MEVISNLFSKFLEKCSNIKNNYYLLVTIAVLNSAFVLIWNLYPYTIVNLPKSIDYIIEFILIFAFNYFILLFFIFSNSNNKECEQSQSPVPFKTKKGSTKKILDGYSDTDKRELLNLALSLQEIEEILRSKGGEIDMSLPALSILWRENALETIKKKKKTLKRGQSIWSLIFGRAFLDNNEIVQNKLLRDFLKIFERIVEDIYESLEGDLNDSKLVIDLFVVLVLLRRLDKNDTCPSVVDIYAADSDKAKKTSNYFETEKFKDATNLKALSAYEILSNITLVEHSVNTALWSLRYIFENNYGYPIVIPAVLVALAHDIGKIPDIYQKELERYSTTDHPYVSVNYLKNMTSFSSMPDNRMHLIENAISKHHANLSKQTDSNNIFFDVLKKADHSAREMEVQAYLQSQGEFMNDELSLLKIAEFDFELGSDQSDSDDDDDEDSIPTLVRNMIKDLKLLMVEKFATRYKIKKKTESQSQPNNTETDTQTKEQQQQEEQENFSTPQNITSEEKNKMVFFKTNKDSQPQTTEFDSEDKLEDIKCVDNSFVENILIKIASQINVMGLSGKGKYFNAFSFDDTVFVTMFFLKKCIKEEFEERGCNDLADIIRKEQQEYMKLRQAEENGEISKDEASEIRVFSQKVLNYVIVKVFQEEYDIINNQYVRKGYIGGFFNIMLEKDKLLNSSGKDGYYAAFKISAFNGLVNISDIEDRKNNPINSTFKSIKKIEFAKKT